MNGVMTDAEYDRKTFIYFLRLLRLLKMLNFQTDVLPVHDMFPCS